MNAAAIQERPDLTHLERLEAESIEIMREVVAEAEKPVMLYNITGFSVSAATSRMISMLSASSRSRWVRSGCSWIAAAVTTRRSGPGRRRRSRFRARARRCRE